MSEHDLLKNNEIKEQTLKHWPSNERPREKLLQQGAPSLSDAE